MTETESLEEREKRLPGAKRAVRNVLWNWSAFLFTAVASFFVAPFVVRSLGNEAYGTWVLLSTIVGYMGLLDFGVRGAVTRFIAHHHGAGDHERAAHFASSGFVVFSATALIAALGGAAIALLLPVFSLPPGLLLQAQIGVVLCAMAISASLITGVFGGIITARERFDLNSGIDIGVEALRILLLVLALRAGHGILALASLQLGAGLVRLLLNVLLSRRVYPQLRLVPTSWSRSHLREIASFGLSTTGLELADRVILQVDAVVIGWFRPVSMITFYAIAGNLAAYARRTISAISMTVTPRVSALDGAGMVKEARAFALSGARLATLALLPIAITFLLRGDTFIGLWMGEEYAGPAGQVLWILSLSLWFDAGRQVIATSLMGLNRHRSLVAPFVGEAVLNLALSIILVRSYGIVGVAWGTTIPRILVTAGVLPIVFARVLEVPLGRLLVDAWVRPSVSMVPFLLGTAFFDRVAEPSSLLGFFAQVALLLPIAAGGALVLGIPGDQRNRVLGRIAVFLPGVSR